MKNKGFILPEVILCIFICYVIIFYIFSIYKLDDSQKDIIQQRIATIEDNFELCLNTIIVEEEIEE